MVVAKVAVEVVVVTAVGGAAAAAASGVDWGLKFVVAGAVVVTFCLESIDADEDEEDVVDEADEQFSFELALISSGEVT